MSRFRGFCTKIEVVYGNYADFEVSASKLRMCTIFSLQRLFLGIICSNIWCYRNIL